MAQERYEGVDLLVTRKGAIRAGSGDFGIIPGSMGTGSYIVKGPGNEASFNSSAVARPWSVPLPGAQERCRAVAPVAIALFEGRGHARQAVLVADGLIPGRASPVRRDPRRQG